MQFSETWNLSNQLVKAVVGYPHKQCDQICRNFAILAHR